jgi:flagellar hook-length control protein FliK
MNLGTLMLNTATAPANRPEAVDTDRATGADFSAILASQDSAPPEQQIEVEAEPVKESKSQSTKREEPKYSDEDNATDDKSPAPTAGIDPTALLLSATSVPVVPTAPAPLATDGTTGQNTPISSVITAPVTAIQTTSLIASDPAAATIAAATSDATPSDPSSKDADIIDALLAKFAMPDADSAAPNSLPAPTMAADTKTPAAANATPEPTAPQSLAVAGEPDTNSPLNPLKPTEASAPQPSERTTLGDKPTATNASKLVATDAPASGISANAPMTAPIPQPSTPQPILMNVDKAPLAAQVIALPPSEQVAVQIVKSAKLGTDKIRIQLSPEDLGRVEIKLEMGKDASVKAVISADKPETAEWLARDAKQLERALADAGFKLDQNNLEFKHNSPNGNQHQAQQFGYDARDGQNHSQKYYGQKNGSAALDTDQNAIIRNYVVPADGINIMA